MKQRFHVASLTRSMEDTILNDKHFLNYGYFYKTRDAVTKYEEALIKLQDNKLHLFNLGYFEMTKTNVDKIFYEYKNQNTQAMI